MRKEIGKFVRTYKASIVFITLVTTVVAMDYFCRPTPVELFERGERALRLKNFDAADALFSRLLQLYPADPAARLKLGDAYKERGWIDDALKQYEFVEKNASDSLLEAYLAMGVANLQKGALDEAISTFAKAIALNPSDARVAIAHLDSASIYEKLHRREDAREHYKQALALDPKNPAMDLARSRLKSLQ